MKPIWLCLVLVGSLVSPAVANSEWPHARGPALDGSITAPGTFDDEGFALDVAWRIPIGSGYSGIAVAGGHAITAFSDAEGDWVAAYAVKSGKQAWRHRMADPHKGFDGSDDGPLSTPTVGKGMVYALDPAGRVVALRLSDGKQAWHKQLDREFGSKAPHFGFTTSPLLDGETLIVQSGAEDGNSIVGLNARSGDVKWSYGDDAVEYQSPTVMTLAGRRQIVAVSAKKITGLATDSGKLLWEHELGEGVRASSATPTFVGDDRFLTLMSGGAGVFRVSRSADGFSVEQVYLSEALGRNYAPPVYHDGHLYGFRGQVLTCVNAADGERVWRSRPPGGDGLILVEDHLVIFGAKGNVVVAEATPDGYKERARAQALDGSSLTWPSFSDGRVFVRNLGEMAAVEITSSPGGGMKAAAATVDHEFGRWVERVEASGDPAALADEFFKTHDSLPLVEGEYVHFVYRGDATDVSIVGTMLDSQSPEALTRVEGTDLFYRTFRLEPASRWEYRFQVDYEEWKIDPQNTRTVPLVDDEGEASELILPGYSTAAHLEAPESPHGRMESLELTSETLGYDKQVEVWLPPGYDATERSYPLLVVNDGEAWLSKGLMNHSLENLVGTSIEPVVVAFVEPTRRWWIEAGGSRTEDYAAMLARELVPMLEKRYRLIPDSGSRALLGNRYFGFSAIYAALRHPDVFGGAAAQSVSIGLGTADALQQLIQERSGDALRFYLDWNRFDERNVDRGSNLGEDSRTLAGMLRDGGYHLDGGEVLDSYGWGGWRNRTDRALVALFPMKEQP